MKFNPIIREWLDENPNASILGLWWAQVWRIYAVFFGIYFGILLLAALAVGLTSLIS